MQQRTIIQLFTALRFDDTCMWVNKQVKIRYSRELLQYTGFMIYIHVCIQYRMPYL